MELPSFHHHHHRQQQQQPRYAPPPHGPPLPPPPTYFNEPQHYPQHRPLPPPPPFSHTPPPSYNSQQSQFTFVNHGNHGMVEDNKHRPQFDEYHRNPSPSRVSNRNMLDDNRSRCYIPEFQNRVSDYRSDTWSDPHPHPPRVAAPESRRQVRFEREKDPRHCQTQVSSYRPSDNRRLDIEGDLRFGDEFQSNHSERVLLGRIDSHGGDRKNDFQRILNDYVSDFSHGSRSSLYRESHMGSNSRLSAPKDFVTDLENYHPFDSYSMNSDRFQRDRNDSRDWNDVRSNFRDLPGLHDEVRNQFDADDDVNIAPSRRGYHRYPSGKSNYRGNREGSQDFLHIPQKKIQKKSALQRLQSGKPSNKDRNNEPHFSFAQSVEAEPKNLRLRSVISYPEKRTEEDRKGSKVELDVSFKSNGLIAKAIVPTSREHESQVNTRLRNRKLGELETPSKDLSNSSDSTVKLDSKNLDAKGVGSGCGFAQDNDIIPSSPQRARHAIDSDTSPRLADSKVTRPLSHVSDSEVSKMDSVPITSGSSRNSVSEDSLCDVILGEANNFSASGSMHGTVLQSSSDQITSLLDNKLMESPRALLAKLNGVHLDSSKVSIPNIEARANTNIFDPLVASSYCVENECDLHNLNVRMSGSIDSFASTDSYKDPIKLQLRDPDSLIMDDIDQQSCVDKPSVSPKSMGGESDSHLSYPASFDHNTHAVNNLLSNESSPADPTFNQTSILLENILVDEDQRLSISLTKDSDIEHLDSSYHIDINETVADAAGSNNTVTDLLASENGKTESQMDLVSNLAQTDSNNDESSQEEATLLLQNSLNEGPTVTSATDNLNVNPVKKQHKKRKIEDSQMDLIKSTSDDVTLNLGCSLHQEEENSSSYTGLTGTSPRCRKKRYIGANVSSSPTLPSIQGSPSCTDIHIPNEELTLVSDKFYIEKGEEVTEFNINTLASSGLPCSDSSVLVDNEMGNYSLDLAREDVLIDSKPEPELAQVKDPEDHNNVEHPLKFATNNSWQNIASLLQVEITLEAETTLQSNPFDAPGQDKDHRRQFADMERDSILPKKDGLSSVSNSTSQYSDRVDPSTVNSHEIVNCVMNVLPNGASLDTLSTDEESHMVDKNYGFENTDFEKPVSESRTPLGSFDKSPSTSTCNQKPGQTRASLHTDTAKTVPSLLQCNPRGTTLRNSHPSVSVPRVFPTYSNIRKAAPLDNKAKPRTWHRTEKAPSLPVHGKNNLNIVSLQKKLSTSIENVQNAYVRKGNSLLRKPSTVAGSANSVSSSVYRLNSLVQDGIKNKAGLDNKVNVVNSLKYSRSELVEKVKTPPLPNTSKLFDCRSISQDSSSLLVMNPPMETSSQSMLGNMECIENADVLNTSVGGPSSSQTPEDQTCVIQSHIVEDNESSKNGTGRKIVYVKNKSNQLVASSASEPSVQNSEQTDGYVKLKRNQLIRKPLEGHALQDVVTLNASSTGTRPIANTSTKRPSVKGIRKTYRRSKGSLVWTLNNPNSSKKESSLVYQVPNLLPWKRSSHWRNVISNSAWVSDKSKNTISKNLLAHTKRDAIYTRSKHGFSLRISKILSVGGSSLKWSKSIERNSRKAKEEATLAVAAVEKKKREQNGASGIGTGTRRKNHSPRKQVFRIGSFRYKMDPSRRTLHRIPGDLTGSGENHAGKDQKICGVPKRLQIGNNEYVRIGNGNQLIRDPKRRVRILASEKIRWSLHTARLRLAKKSTYCQFLTRFGKCNKDGGKCPYIHDPSKIAVCTKFIKGSCSNPSCKLTHKVIPERMEDCSYFLQGLCFNKDCPYRHVNVNPNAPACEGFLRGYCVHGDECRKKHSYVCPVFEATGSCPQGTKCRLRHLKRRSKGGGGKKRKISKESNNANKGRYFGKSCIDVVSVVGEKTTQPSKREDCRDVFFQEGRFADFISIDVSEDEDEEVDHMIESSCSSGLLLSGDSMDYIEAQIKPDFVLKKRRRLDLGGSKQSVSALEDRAV
ncbi:uncharacterized protein LOC124944639 [Impatiens glandulifera]|uniref:uncharacterized protein LOC124944639 n=1 Tax=Impatiens glandulifera TaxID=253017 RepID=UPI001FB06670|nr:uncharacterized protein LOC124944639 [Impatiens glandulifera]